MSLGEVEPLNHRCCAPHQNFRSLLRAFFSLVRSRTIQIEIGLAKLMEFSEVQQLVDAHLGNCRAAQTKFPGRSGRTERSHVTEYHVTGTRVKPSAVRLKLVWETKQAGKLILPIVQNKELEVQIHSRSPEQGTGRRTALDCLRWSRCGIDGEELLLVLMQVAGQC
jgi:hypothetical protein